MRSEKAWKSSAVLELIKEIIFPQVISEIGGEHTLIRAAIFFNLIVPRLKPVLKVLLFCERLGKGHAVLLFIISIVAVCAKSCPSRAEE